MTDGSPQLWWTSDVTALWFYHELCVPHYLDAFFSHSKSLEGNRDPVRDCRMLFEHLQCASMAGTSSNHVESGSWRVRKLVETENRNFRR